MNVDTMHYINFGGMMVRVLYGVSQNAINKLNWIIEKYDPTCFCDIDEKKWNLFIGGLMVYSLEYIVEHFKDCEFIITMKDIYTVRSAFNTLVKGG